MERSQATASVTNLMDTHQKLIADILTHYRTLMMLATNQAEGERNNRNPESAAATGISMKCEFEALYASIKDLLTLSRRIKELWIFGPLGRDDPNLKATEEKIERDALAVAEMYNKLHVRKMTDLAEKYGGTWEEWTDEHEAEFAAIEQPETAPATVAPA